MASRTIALYRFKKFLQNDVGRGFHADKSYRRRAEPAPTCRHWTEPVPYIPKFFEMVLTIGASLEAVGH